MLKNSWCLNCWNNCTTIRNYAVTYYKTLLEEVPWHLRLKELKNWQNFQKAWKKLQNLVQNCVILAIGCSSVATGGGGGWRVLGAEGEKGGGVLSNSGVGGNSSGGGGGGNSAGGRGVNSGGGVSSTSENRPSHHKYKSPKQFGLKQSWKVLRALSARWTLPVYPVFEDERSKASDEKSVKRKIALKKTDRTNIIATNFVWEQLNINRLASDKLL